MNLRWYQTYDKNGVVSEMTLQLYDAKLGDWEDIPIEIEREESEDSDD